MAVSTIGAIEAFTLNWLKAVPFAHSSVVRQPSRNGNTHSIGAVYSDPSTIRSEHFLTSKTQEKSFLLSCAALCGEPQLIVEAVQGGLTVDHEDVFIESVKLVKGGYVAGGPGAYHMILEWVVYLPENWS